METHQMHVAIVGAGMAGLSCASSLARSGLRVTVFDKGRGPGGRMAARRAEVNGNLVSFDHGAQSFSATNDAFAQAVRDWHRLGAVEPWPARGGGEWVGVPGMNGPLRAMALPLGVRWAERIETLEPTGQGWRVGSAVEDEEFTDVAVAIPAEQAAVLLRPVAPKLADIPAQIGSHPCWAVMVSFAEPLPVAQDFIEFTDGDGRVSLASRNSAKPHRPGGGENWVLHASPTYSEQLLEQDAVEVAPQILSAFFEQANVTPIAPIHMVAHRWRYAVPNVNLGEGSTISQWDADRRIGIAGDYLAAPNVEGAWLSGQALAQQILG